MEKTDGTHFGERENYASSTNEKVNTDLREILTFIIRDYRNPFTHINASEMFACLKQIALESPLQLRM